MSTLKSTLTLLITFSAFLIKSQSFVLNGSTYIGKTQKEIDQINETIHSKLFSKEKVGHITSIVYEDSLNSLTHQFFFARKFRFGPIVCFAYLVTMGDRSQYEKTKDELLAGCEEKIAGKQRAVQLSGKKKYLWHYFGSDTSKLYVFSIEKFHEPRNRR